ncbi:hypothetical protein [Labrenzia sp. VG12]|uniref:hypothetical protein n=1 Tax=Labrenzia sp. VG12 TaxID=2021862 RepID=UPI000B8BC6FA|nr:hypothetical protein [Labrenzia sp. VG12]ASP32772.1 hypothetical protein CHH27_05530 [Labrenzia sp. VG12]
MSEQCQAEDGLICRADSMPYSTRTEVDECRYRLQVPADTAGEATDFLSQIGGGMAGTGRGMTRIGIESPILRDHYHIELKNLAKGIADRAREGQSDHQIARWVVEERLRIARRLRAMATPATRPLYIIRDWRKYGFGKRGYDSQVNHYLRQGIPEQDVDSRILRSASKSNPKVNTAMKGAAYLKHGGRVLLVIGVSVSIARIWNADEHELPRVISEELGALAGGGIGAAVGAGACIIFGVTTAGWGLLACGVVGGGLGSWLGSELGGNTADRLFYTDMDIPENQHGEIIIEIPSERIYDQPPPRMCLPPMD